MIGLSKGSMPLLSKCSMSVLSKCSMPVLSKGITVLSKCSMRVLSEGYITVLSKDHMIVLIYIFKGSMREICLGLLHKKIVSTRADCIVLRRKYCTTS
jgi:hypothetical protein